MCNNPSVPGENSFTASNVIKTIAYTVLMLVSLLGNSLVILIVWRRRHMRTTTNLLITNMAASDLLISLFAVPREITEIFFGPRRWLIQGVFGLVTCKVVYLLQDISTAVSIQSLVVISVSRFSAIVFPFRAPFITTKSCKVIIPVTWLAACAIHSVYLYIFRLVSTGNKTYCIVSWEPAFNSKKAQETYYIFLLIFIIILPLLTIVVLHCVMIVELRKLRRTLSGDWSLGQLEEAKATKKIVIIMLAFVFCIMPINVCSILFFFVWDWVAPCGVNMELLFYVTKFILFSNASINPSLYFVLYERYRQGLKDIFTGTNPHARNERARRRESDQKQRFQVTTL